MNNNDGHCSCSNEGYSSECPQVFMQGGRLLHSIESETKLKPRIFGSPDGHSLSGRKDRRDHLVGPSNTLSDPQSVNVPDGRMEHFRTSEGALIRDNSTASNIMKGKVLSQGDDLLYEQIENTFPRGLSVDPAPLRPGNRAHFMNSEDMMEQNRQVLRKYEPLQVGGLQLTDLSIGGFEVDLSKAAQKASSVAPLPPAKLPRIYIDHDMNFLHHFFQGLDRLLGRDKVLMLVGQDKYYTVAELILLPFIEDVLRTGWEKKDTNLTVFAKSVLSSTFECDEKSGSEDEQRGLVVAANLWGFQYIECGMEMKESDLRMWLSISYSHFRTIHFNTFKDSGMPAFAMEGVQTRYEDVTPKKYMSRDQLYGPVGAGGAVVPYKVHQYESDDEIRSQSGRRRRQHRKQEPTIGTMLFGRRGRDRV